MSSGQVSLSHPQLLQAGQGDFKMPNLKNRQLTLQSHCVHEVSGGWGDLHSGVCVFVSLQRTSLIHFLKTKHIFDT